MFFSVKSVENATGIERKNKNVVTNYSFFCSEKQLLIFSYKCGIIKV